MRTIAATALLAAAVSAPLALAGSRAEPKLEPKLDERRAAIAKEIVRLGAALRREIVAGDAEALLSRVPPEGLRCGGRLVPRAKVARDLRGDGTWLHVVFFGKQSSAVRPGPGTPASLAELLRQKGEIAIVVYFEADPRFGPAGRPCLDFRMKDLATPGVPLCFEERGGRWWFTESLYPCG